MYHALLMMMRFEVPIPNAIAIADTAGSPATIVCVCAVLTLTAPASPVSAFVSGASSAGEAVVVGRAGVLVSPAATECQLCRLGPPLPYAENPSTSSSSIPTGADLRPPRPPLGCARDRVCAVFLQKKDSIPQRAAGWISFPLSSHQKRGE